MDKETYLLNPCRALSIPLWKHNQMKDLPQVKIYHAEEYSSVLEPFSQVSIYFRLIHHLKQDFDWNVGVESIVLDEDGVKLVEHINACYKSEGITVSLNDIETWRQRSVYDSSLWVKIEENNQIVASGIAEYDIDVKEGILEWIQVHPDYQGKGYGKRIVSTLLYLLSGKADFVTVSGNVTNATQPIHLYRACGFEGDDQFYVCR